MANDRVSNSDARGANDSYWPVEFQSYDDRPFIRYVARAPDSKNVILVGFARSESEANKLIDEQIGLITLRSDPPDKAPDGALPH